MTRNNDQSTNMDKIPKEDALSNEQSVSPTAPREDRIKKLYNTPKKRLILYLIGSLLLLYFFSSVYPFLLDYYLEGSRKNVVSYVCDLYLFNHPYHEYEILLIFLTTLFLYFLTSSPGWSAGILSILCTILAYASKIKYENRMELINYTDLKLTKEAATFAEYLKFRPTLSLLYLILFSVLITGAGITLHMAVRKDLILFKKKILILRLSLPVILAIILCFYQNNFIKKEHSRRIDQTIEYLTDNGNRYLLYHFLASDHITYAPSEALRSYNSMMDRVKEMELPSRTIDDYNIASAPSVIVIMNESWWDLDHIPQDNIIYSEDPMKPLRELKSKCNVGSVAVNIYGGGTICSEEEYKLGVNTKYFSSSLTIYETLAERDFTSITGYFNQLGYHTTAIHPYSKDFYGRTELYQKEGYNDILFQDEMDYTTRYDRYISDDALVDQIIHEFEKNSDPSKQREYQPQYIYALSIGTHVTSLEYEEPFNENYDYPIQVTFPEGVEIAHQQDIIHYVNGIYYSNLAIQKLINYLENQDRPVMVIMYGDHCPGFNVYDLRELGLEAGGEGENHVDIMKVDPGQMGDPVEQDVLEALYTCPCLEWDNFSDRGFSCEKENVSFLSSKIIDHAGLPDTPSTLMQKLLQTSFKTDIRVLTIDRDGNRINSLSKHQYELAQDSLMVQYDFLYGDQVCGDLWQPISDQ